MFNNRENKMYVVDGGEKIYHSRSVAVVALVVLINRYGIYILLAKRGDKAADERGKWNMPCGYLDWDETSQEAVYRELWEETGFDVREYVNNTNARFLYNSDQPYLVTTKPTANRQNVSLYHAIIIENTAVNQPTVHVNNADEGEVSEVQWVPLNTIGSFLFENEIAFNHKTQIVNGLKRFNHFVPTFDLD